MSRREALAWSAAAFLLATTALTAWLAAEHAREAARSSRPIRAWIGAPTGERWGGPGSSSSPRLSPGGDRVAFVASDAGGVSRLWIRPLDSLEAAALPGTEGAALPFWSPDGTSVAFFADGRLKAVLVEGPRIVEIADAPGAAGGAWIRDGTIVFSSEAAGGLLRVPATGGVASPATRLREPDDLRHRAPCPLPDGRHVAYLAISRGADGNERGLLRLSALDGSDDADLVPSDSGAEYARGFLVHRRGERLVATPLHRARLTIGGEAVPVEESVAAPGRWEATFSVAESGVLVFAVGLSARERADASMLRWSQDTAPLVVVSNWDPEPLRR